jgi:hypothetical protein
MEADAQCVQLEMAGVVAGSITRDGDLFVHGSKLLVFMENWNSDGKCHIVKRSEGLEALGREYDLGRSFNDHEVRLWKILIYVSFISLSIHPSFSAEEEVGIS